MSFSQVLEPAVFIGLVLTGVVLSLQDLKKRFVNLWVLVVHGLLTALLALSLIFSKTKGVFGNLEWDDSLVSLSISFFLTGAIHLAGKMRKREYLAMGDVVFFTISSALVPPLLLPVAFLGASSLGIIWHLIAKMTQNKNGRQSKEVLIPTIPFIFLSFTAVFVWRERISDVFFLFG